MLVIDWKKEMPKIKGVYKLNKKFASRISRSGQTIHLGTYDTKDEAGMAYDTACLILGKPDSSFNRPDKFITVGRIQKILSVMREKGFLEADDIVVITNRFMVINELAETISEGRDDGSIK